MAELRLNGEMNLLSTRYRVSSDCACRFKRQKWMVEVLRETSSDIGRIGLTGHERELLLHDLNALALVAGASVPIYVIVINNHSGAIFHFFDLGDTGERLRNPHQWGFRGVAENFH